jgi:cation diffusion facilitator family transporter
LLYSAAMGGARQSASTRLVIRAAWIGMVGNVLLAAVKLVAGVFGHSQALVADAVHSISDLATDLAVLFGVRYWSAPADDRHPHGHRRIETVITVAIGVTLAAVAVGLGWEAIRGLGEQDRLPPTPLALAAALLSIASKEWMYRWTLGLGRKADSSALIANAWHHRSDALSSVPVVVAVGVTLVRPQWAAVDHVGAAVVCVFILYAAWTILAPAMGQLVDEGAPLRDRQLLEEIALSVDGVLSAHALRTRYTGPKLAVDLHVEVDGELSVSDGYQIAQKVRRELLAKGPNVADVLVQVEPFRPDREPTTGSLLQVRR